MNFFIVAFIFIFSLTSFAKDSHVSFLQQSVVDSLVQTHPEKKQTALYDQALMILYFLSEGKKAEAEKLLLKTLKFQNSDGSFPFVIQPESTLAVYKRTGANAWIGYASLALLNDSSTVERKTIIEATHRLAYYLLSLQITDKKDSRYGLLTGGFGNYIYELDEKKSIKEIFLQKNISWISTEHNIDSYFFFRNFYRMTKDNRYKEAALLIKKSLLTTMWDSHKKTFYQGRDEKEVNPVAALDCASWGALFLNAIGKKEMARQALLFAEKNFKSQNGFKPYSNKALFDSRVIALSFADKYPENSWQNIEGVWPEGTAGAALAYYRLGDKKRAEELATSLEKLRNENGSLPDFTTQIPYEFSAAPSIASTIWLDQLQKEMNQKNIHLIFSF